MTTNNIDQMINQATADFEQLRVDYETKTAQIAELQKQLKQIEHEGNGVRGRIQALAEIKALGASAFEASDLIDLVQKVREEEAATEAEDQQVE